MQKQAQVLIETRQLSKSFEGEQAVNKVDLSIRAGEIVALLGANGAGKTTLINMLLGRLKPDSGSIEVAGFAPGTYQAKQLIGAILQSTKLPDNLTVAEQIRLFLSYYANPYDYDELVDIAKLSTILNKRFKQLSGGQKQRVFFALAICGQPKVAFLDEPTVGLDAESRREFWACIRRLAANGTSVLLTTHYMAEAEALADRVYLLKHGEMIHEGSPDSLVNALGAKTIRFKSATSISHFEKMTAILSADMIDGYIQLSSANVVQSLREILNVSDINELTVYQKTLEDAFLALTGESHELLKDVKKKESKKLSKEKAA
uniref:ABC transporter ATP-binding protein n=1 Tax=Ningiella ruwaisensis TaxID=2364274 RepID=UPI00109FF1BF|nr:ABC transporter ATP-binding protein [Ningiella ruwaisensis]